jgi:Flp pilus assembly protein TadD
MKELAILIGMCAVLFAAGCASHGPAAPIPPASETVAAGDQASQRGDYKTALLLYSRALESQPSTELWLRIAAAHSARGDRSAAAEAFRSILELDPDHALALESLGLLYVQQRRVELARIHLERALQTQRSSWRTYNGLGVLADIDGDHGGAMSLYEQALAKRPDSMVILNNIGYSLFLADRLDDAEATFKRILERSTYEPSVMNLALVYGSRGEYRRAVAMLSDVLTPSAAYNDVGFVAMANGHFDDADWLFAKAIRLSPVHYGVAQKNLALNRALALDERTVR